MNLLSTQEYLVVSSVPGLGSHLSHLGLKGHPPSRLDRKDPICSTLDLQVIPAAIPPHTWDSRWDRWDLFHVGLKRPMILVGMGRSLSVHLGFRGHPTCQAHKHFLFKLFYLFYYKRSITIFFVIHSALHILYL